MSEKISLDSSDHTNKITILRFRNYFIRKLFV